MANNIQIIGNILNTNTISRYSTEDTNLIESQDIQETFNPIQDYIEYYIYDNGGNLINLDYNYVNYKLPTTNAITPLYTPAPNPDGSINSYDSSVVNTNPLAVGSSFSLIEIDPIKDLQQAGYNSGEFKVQYNFFSNKVSSPAASFFLKRISSDRTEISITSAGMSNIQIEAIADGLLNEINNSPFYTNYLINFGLNQQFNAVNVALDKIESNYEILFKLYEPLPDNIVEKTSLWVVGEKVTPYVFDINLDVLISPPTPLTLRGANFNIPVSVEVNTISSQYNNYSNLVSSLQVSQSNTYNKLLNTLTSQSIAINVDYTNYDNFAFFGSVESRLNNFYDKVKQIEDYNSLITSYTLSASLYPNLQTEITLYSSSISNIISTLDGYETYLYFESSSYAWPKSTSVLPYILYSTGSASVINWFNTNINLASSYDELNQNNFKNSIPLFLVNDTNNSQYLVFLSMVGQYFDNIWILLKSITDINLSNNNLTEGISKDLVKHVLKSYGINLYNSSGGEDLNTFLVGNNTGSAVYSGSLNNFSYTSSYLNNIPKNDLLSETYKRIYHNLPYLVKTKGTITGLKAIISLFGITGSILNVKEYGGETSGDILKGYSSNKVRAVGNIAIGNTLSPLVSIQQSPSSSIEFIDNDLPFVDISFSPQTQLDLYVSQSISATNSTWDLDNYIGDPRQIYSGSYPDLTAQRKIYFEQGTGSYAGFTGSLLDYNGFIRLIQFFDNSLFKTLEDFVPLRTSLSTGITFNSPVLERNKFAYSKPNTSTTESIKTAEFTTSSIGTEYGNFYNKLSNNKSAYYTGELSGSIINSYESYFIPSNQNPYLGNFTTWNNQHSITESIDTTKFSKSEFNVLLNNIPNNKLSNNRRTIELPTGQQNFVSSSNSITSISELQDSYLSLSSYTKSRHAGIKITSAKYNEYTNGDSGSYGLTSAIDKFQTQFLVFNEIRGTYPELVGGSVLFINSLIDKNGSRLNADKTGSTYYYDLIDGFGKDKPVDIQCTTANSSGSQSAFHASTTIIRSGYDYPKTILTNESGSSYAAGYPVFYTKDINIDVINPLAPLSNINTILSKTNFWTVGNASKNVLTSSFDLGNLLQDAPNNPKSLAQNNLNNTYAGMGGYDPITQYLYETPNVSYITSSFKYGQEIRFLQNEDYAFTIQSSIISGSASKYNLCVTLDREIPDAIISSLNNGFLLREWVSDSSKLTLKLNTPGNSKGYLVPKYIYPDLTNNFDKIISSLKESGTL